MFNTLLTNFAHNGEKNFTKFKTEDRSGTIKSKTSKLVMQSYSEKILSEISGQWPRIVETEPDSTGVVQSVKLILRRYCDTNQSVRLYCLCRR